MQETKTDNFDMSSIFGDFFGRGKYVVKSADEKTQKKFKSAFKKVMARVKSEKADVTKRITQPVIRLDLENDDLIIEYFQPVDLYWLGYYIHQYESDNV